MRFLFLVFVFLAFAGLGASWSAFSGQASSAGNTFTATDWAPSFVQNVGSASCSGAQSTLAVPAGGVTADNSVVVVVGLRGTTAGAVSVTDSAGNAYAISVDSTTGTLRTVVLKAQVVTSLPAGATITVTHPDTDAEAVVAGEFWGVSGGVADTNTASGTLPTPSLAVSVPAADDLLTGALSAQNAVTLTEAPGWSSMGDVQTNCGRGARGRMTLHAAHRVAPSAGGQAYAPVISVATSWAAALVAYSK